MVSFWLGAAALIVLATSFLLIPLWRDRGEGAVGFASGPLIALAIVPVAFGLYLQTSTFDPDAPLQPAGSEEMALLERLATQLQGNPDDVEGWRLLGRSYRELGDYQRARLAFQEAWRRTTEPDNALKVNYAESLLVTDPSTAMGLAGELLDEVLLESPGDQAALWLGGIAAMESGRAQVAVERFSALLDSGPPPEIADIIRRQIMALTEINGSDNVAAGSGSALAVEVTVGDDVSLEAFGPNARLYILARAADSPMPIAVTQNALSTLPGTFTLDDSNSMAGRSLGQVDSVTVTARISASGSASAAPGDVYDEVTVAVDSAEPIQLVIDKVVSAD